MNTGGEGRRIKRKNYSRSKRRKYSISSSIFSDCALYAAATCRVQEGKGDTGGEGGE